MDDRRWLLPCHYLHQGRDKVKALLLALLTCLWHYLSFFPLRKRVWDLPDVLQLTGLFWLGTDSLLLHFSGLPETPKAAGRAEGL